MHIRQAKWFIAALLVMFALQSSAAAPQLQTEVVTEGLSHPWALQMLPDGSILFTQRSGGLKLLREDNVLHITDVSEVAAHGEGGLTGLALDNLFHENRFIYLAYNTRTEQGPQVQVTRFRLTEGLELSEPAHIVTGLPAVESGRHSGTALAMGKDGVLFIGTGDAATGSNPQNPKSLGGKVLRVNRQGEPVAGNLPEPFDPRIFSYGHRNTQGLVLLDNQINGLYGYSAEHGSNIEDEFNPLLPGNFGWDPPLPYREVVPMTDKTKYPDAVEAIWDSGSSTIAVSGLTQLRGEAWGSYEGAFVMGVLKRQQLRLLWLEEGRLVREETLFQGQFGRIRAVMMGTDGALYLGTDNGDDRIIRVTPE